jgi:protein TonB
MRTTLTALVLCGLGFAGCATRGVAPPLSPQVALSLDDFRRTLDEATPSDPVFDDRDPSVKARLTPPVELHRVQPALSRAARAQSREGKVALACVIERNGSVSNVKVLSATGHGDFTAASVAAVRRWRYTPAKRDGSPVRLLLTVTTSYRVH